MRIVTTSSNGALARFPRTIVLKGAFLIGGLLVHLASLGGMFGSQAFGQLTAIQQQAAATMAASPYLNLNGSVFGNLPNYNLKVEPFAQTQGSLGQQGGQLQHLQEGVAKSPSRGSTSRARNSTFGGRNASGLVTGHATRYGVLSHYFPGGTAYPVAGTTAKR